MTTDTRVEMRQLLNVSGSKAERAIEARASIPGHVRYIHQYEPKEHHLEWYDYLNDQSITRLIIVAPPKFGKTPTIADYLSYRIGHDPNYHCLYISNTAGQAYKPSIAIRDLIDKDDTYKEVYGQGIDRTKGWSSSAWYVKRENLTDKDPTLQAVGIHGPILGATVQEIFLDDVADQENMKTAYQREELMSWLRLTAFSRLVPGGRIIMTCTRWDEDDPVAQFAKEGWVVVEIPQIALDDELAWTLDEKQGWKLTPEGQLALTYPEFWDAKSVEQARIDLGFRQFLLMHQQKIMPDKGSIFKRDWWKYYDEGELPEVLMVVGSWDTAHEKSSGASYSASEHWAVCANGYYLIDAWREHIEFPGLKRTFINQNDLHRPGAILLEKKASGITLYQEMTAKSTLPIIPIIPTTDKVSRANACTPTVEAGKVFLPRNAPWRPMWEAEHEMFPGGTHDDWVDASTMFLNWIRLNGLSMSLEEIDEAGELEKESMWKVE